MNPIHSASRTLRKCEYVLPDLQGCLEVLKLQSQEGENSQATGCSTMDNLQQWSLHIILIRSHLYAKHLPHNIPS